MLYQDMPALERMKKARAALVTNPAYAFFGCLALRLRLQGVPWCKTMTTDGDSLFFNPAYVESLKEGETMGVIAHEVFHLARLHHVRRGGRDLSRWNEACDYTINPDLIKLGFQLPGKPMLQARFEGMGAEEVFGILEREARQKQQSPEQDKQEGGDDGDSGSGGGDDEDGNDSGSSRDDGDESGDGGDNSSGDDCGAPGDGPEARPAPDPGACGGVIDAAPDESGMNDKAAEIEAAVRQAVSVAKAANAGTLPAFLERLVTDLNESRVDWRAAIADFVDDAATRALAWERPNKRFLGGPFYMPGNRADSVSKLVSVVDSSGSIDAPVLSVMRDQLQAILDTGRVECVQVIYCHHKTHGGQEFRKGESIVLNVTETGGTLFGPAFREIEEQHPDAAAIIYLTDLEPAPGHPDAWGIEPAAPVLWAVIGSKREAPFGTVLPVDIHA